MSEYLSKKAVLEWLKKRLDETQFVKEAHALAEIVAKIECGRFDDDQNEVQRLRAENERYRKALERIAETDIPYAPMTDHSVIRFYEQVAREALSTTSEPTAQWVTRTWSHHCPNINDNYGPQVVEYGDSCPFCGINAPGGDQP